MSENVKVSTHERVNAVVRRMKIVDGGQEVEESKIMIEGDRT